MTFLQFKKIARWSGLRAALLGAMGLVTLLFPEFLQGSIIYAVVAYAILNGALGILDFLSGRGREEKHIAYLNLFITAAAILFGILSIVYFRYLISIMPVFSGVLLLIESVVYFIAALCAESRLKALLVILSLLVAVVGESGSANSRNRKYQSDCPPKLQKSVQYKSISCRYGYGTAPCLF